MECPETETDQKLSECDCFPKCEHYRDKQAQRIKELEECLFSMLEISDLWLPAQGELLSGEHTGEAQALCEMFSRIKGLLK